MEIILSDEKDERFIELCESFDCEVCEEQVVLLLSNFSKTVGCTSFKAVDSNSCEITTLFIVSFENRQKIAYKLVRQIEKIAFDLNFRNIFVCFETKDDILFEIFEKLDYDFFESDDEIVMKKEFKSLL